MDIFGTVVGVARRVVTSAASRFSVVYPRTPVTVFQLTSP
jgi:hypothetical protein